MKIITKNKQISQICSNNVHIVNRFGSKLEDVMTLLVEINLITMIILKIKNYTNMSLTLKTEK